MQFEHIKNNLAEHLINNENYSHGREIGLIGKVIELYDSTGIAKWKVYGNFSLERPRKGDEIYLTY